MHDLLRDCADIVGFAPRKFPVMTRLRYLKILPPAWLRCHPDDDLSLVLKHQRKVFRDGILVWGHVIQANTLMFQDGTEDCPGEVVYSLEDRDLAEPEDLREVAYQLFSLKETVPEEPELQPIADYLTDEVTRVFGLSVPPIVSPRLRCRISTTLFLRKHLPYRRLCSPVLPMLVIPVEPYVALPLPERYWPEQLLEHWARSAASF